jgi:hypothetical protein
MWDLSGGLSGLSILTSGFVLVVFLVVAEKFSNFGSMHDHLVDCGTANATLTILHNITSVAF